MVIFYYLIKVYFCQVRWIFFFTEISNYGRFVGVVISDAKNLFPLQQIF